MSEIPFVNALGDALENAFAEEPARWRRRIRRPRLPRRRSRLIIALAALAVAGGIAGARALLNSTTLATHVMVCYDGTGFGGSMAEIGANGPPPLQACAPVLRRPASSLIACAGGRGDLVDVFVADGRRNQCHRIGLAPLPASYAAGHARVDRLASAIGKLQHSAYCIPAAKYVARAQRILDRLGWSGWRAVVATGRSSEVPGPCAQVPIGGTPQIDLGGALDSTRSTLTLALGPPPSMYGTLAALDKVVTADAVGRCFTAAALRADVTRRLAAQHLTGAFALSAEPANTQLEARSQAAYARGCALVFGVDPAPNRLYGVNVWTIQAGAPAPPTRVGNVYGILPPSAYR